jgi:hypothetical protein
MIARFIPFNPLGEFRTSLAPDISRATHAEHRAVNGWAKAPPQAERDEDRGFNRHYSKCRNVGQSGDGEDQTNF